MKGGAGNDTYIVDNRYDKIVELVSSGTDTIKSSVSYTLSANVENLTLTGSNSINASGNGLKNILIGNTASNILDGGTGNDILNSGAGADTLKGGLGNDILTGGAGKDSFVFNTKLGSTNVDKIRDFNVVDDTIKLENGIFTKLTTIGTLNSAFFKANTDGKAKDNNDYLVYETDTGKLFYDADGNGLGAAILFATIENKASLTYADFTVI